MILFLIFVITNLVIGFIAIIEEWLYYKVNKEIFHYEPEWIKNKNLPWRKAKMNNHNNDNQ